MSLLCLGDKNRRAEKKPLRGIAKIFLEGEREIRREKGKSNPWFNPTKEKGPHTPQADARILGADIAEVLGTYN